MRLGERRRGGANDQPSVARQIDLFVPDEFARAAGVGVQRPCGFFPMGARLVIIYARADIGFGDIVHTNVNARAGQVR